MAANMESLSSRDLFQAVNKSYEDAYSNNHLQRACIEKLISLLKPQSAVLDCGCGTGKPVAASLAAAGHHITGFDISPAMLEHARVAVPDGDFTVGDLQTYKPERRFGAVVVMFSHFWTPTWEQFHAALWRLLESLEKDGYFAMATAPAEKYVAEKDVGKVYDETNTYTLNYPVPFLGDTFNSLLLTKDGIVRFLSSMGLEVVYDVVDLFQPDHPSAVGEWEQFVIARRVSDAPLSEPKPSPKK